MKCPTCQSVDLLISDRQGIEIDHCPKCRGVWLDRGELDKIIDRANGLAGVVSGPHGPGARRSDSVDDDDDDYRRRTVGYPADDRHRRRKPFWAELFD